MKRRKPEGEARLKPDPIGPGADDTLRMPACKIGNSSALSHCVSTLGLWGLGILATLMFSVSAAAQTRTWNINGGGSWNTAGNWSPLGAPNGIGATAVINRTNTPTATRTVTLSTPVSIGTLIVGTRSLLLTAGGTGKLIFDATAGPASLTFVSGIGLTLNTEIDLADTLEITGSGSIAFNRTASGAGGLTFDGTSDGISAEFNAANTYSGDTRLARSFAFVLHPEAIPAGTTLTVGDESGDFSWLFWSAPMPFAMTSANAFNLVIEAGSIFSQVSGNRYFATSLSGEGIFESSLEITGTGSDASFAGTIMGGSSGPEKSLTKTGPSRQTLSGANSYVDATLVSGGSLIAASDQALGSAAPGEDDATFVHGSGSLGITGNVTVAETIRLNGTGGGNGALQNISGNNVLTGPVRIGWGFDDPVVPANSVAAADATIDVATGTTLTLTGAVDGTKALIKTGTGTLTLTGAGSWTGGTTVSAGTLRGDTANLQGDIANSATVEFAQGADGTYGGTISGAGEVLKTGGGTLTLTGAGSWTGGTTVSAGTLRGSTLNLQGDILNNAAVVFDQTNDDAFGGTITGSGQVVKQGAGTLTLTQPRLWTGGTAVLAGALQGSGETFQGPILNESVLIFDQATDAVFDWEIAGGGLVVKRGAGSLSLGGPALESDELRIEAGTLSLNTTTEGSITVLDGARLGGMGQAGGAVVAQDGVIAPGNSIGTLTLASLDTSGISEVEYRAPDPGTYTFISSGTGQSIRGRNVLLDPGLVPADQDADLLHVTGLAQLNPGSRVVLHSLGSADTFDRALSDPANTNGELRYLILRADGGLEGRFVALSETGARLDYLAGSGGAQDVWLVLRDLVPVVVTGAAPAPWVLPMMTDDRPGCDPAGTSGGRCAFVQGTFEDGGLDAEGAAAGADWSGWQGIVGAGQEVADGVWLGFGLGQWSGDLSRPEGGAAGAGFDRYGAYLWGTYAKGPLDLRGWIGFGQDEVSGTRDTALGARAAAEFEVTQSFAAIEARHWFSAGQDVSVTPLLALSAGRLSQDGYSETGGGVENFTASAQSRTSLRSLIGVEGNWRAGSEARPVSLTASAGWGHEFGDTGSVLTGTYEGDVTGTVLTGSSAAEDRNRLEIGLGGVFRVTDRSSLRLGYELSVAGSSTRQTATARWSFSF
jgi:fibronectin-binding autotransporter adhesin